MTVRKPPKSCSSMAELRVQIDALDAELVSLLALRAQYIDRAIDLKPGENMKARVPERVEEVVSKVRAVAEEKGLDPEMIEGLWRQIIEWSIAREADIID